MRCSTIWHIQQPQGQPGPASSKGQLKECSKSLRTLSNVDHVSSQCKTLSGKREIYAWRSTFTLAAPEPVCQCGSEGPWLAPLFVSPGAATITLSSSTLSRTGMGTRLMSGGAQVFLSADSGHFETHGTLQTVAEYQRPQCRAHCGDGAHQSPTNNSVVMRPWGVGCTDRAGVVTYNPQRCKCTIAVWTIRIRWERNVGSFAASKPQSKSTL